MRKKLLLMAAVALTLAGCQLPLPGEGNAEPTPRYLDSVDSPTDGTKKPTLPPFKIPVPTKAVLATATPKIPSQPDATITPSEHPAEPTKALQPTNTPSPTKTPVNEEIKKREEVIKSIPGYSGQTVINLPRSGFDHSKTETYETFSELDSLGRCGAAEALLHKSMMPTEERGEIGMVKPSGWHTVKYPDLIEDLYLYNRCHLIGFQFTGQNAEPRNLITGTRHFNIETGMESYENMLASYLRRTGNHAYYRVIPVYEGNNLVATGVWMEAESVEDDEISFSIFVYNVQPGIWIDYATGESGIEAERNTAKTYIINTNTKKFHKEDCENIVNVATKNKEPRVCTREELLKDGYDPCGWCNP